MMLQEIVIGSIAVLSALLGATVIVYQATI